MADEPVKPESADGKYIVRVYDGFDNQWCDVTGPVSWDEALGVWKRETKDGTEKTNFNDIDYYRIFPANSEMYFSKGRGERIF